MDSKIKPWLYKGQPFDPPAPIDPKVCQGFIYRITNKVDGRVYFGRKWVVFKTTKSVKGKKKKLLVESDWRTYFGSNEELNQDVRRLGSDSFQREILYFVPSKGVGNYLETAVILRENAIIRPDCYNSWVSAKITRKHLQRFAAELLTGNLSDRIFEILQQTKVGVGS